MNPPPKDETIPNLYAHLRWWSDPDVCGPVESGVARDWARSLDLLISACSHPHWDMYKGCLICGRQLPPGTVLR